MRQELPSSSYDNTTSISEHSRQEKTPPPPPERASPTVSILLIPYMLWGQTLFGQECDEWWDAAVGSSAISHLYHKPPHQEERATNRTYNSGSSTQQQLDKSENRRKAGLWLKQTEKAEHTVPFTMWVASRFYKILRCFHDSCEIILLIMTCLCI